jgi:hypothetical protein
VAIRFAQSKFRNFFRELWILKYFGVSWEYGLAPGVESLETGIPPFLLKKMKNNKNKCPVRVSTDLSLFPSSSSLLLEFVCYFSFPLLRFIAALTGIPNFFLVGASACE